MKNVKSTNVLFFILLFAYHHLFWQEQMGINTLLFAALLVISLMITKADEGFSKSAWTTIICTLLTAVLVVLNNSGLSKIMHLLSVILMMGFVHRADLKHTVYAFIAGALAGVTTPLNIALQIGSLEKLYKGFRPIWLYARFGIIPLSIVGMFYALYAFANPKFADLSGRFANHTTDFLAMPFQHLSLEWVGFIILGLFLVGGMLWSPFDEWLKNRQAKQTEVLLRRRQVRDYVASFRMLDLKNEYRIALMVVLSLNGLLFVVNMIDIKYLWLNSTEQSPAALSQFVHEGTYLLIISIVLAMSVLILFFRDNLNFYKKNNLLRLAAYAWILQNSMLALSVGMRNFKYIDAYGLAYKRIGVMIFLVLTLLGLLTMFYKIRDIKSFYYLLKTNTWALYLVMVLTCFINWDVAITRYNLTADTKTIDMKFLLDEVSDKNLFVLYENRDRIIEKTNYNFRLIENKRQQFEARQKKYGWASWNYADYRNR